MITFNHEKTFRDLGYGFDVMQYGRKENYEKNNRNNFYWFNVNIFIGFAEMRLIERKIVDGNYLSSMCVDGYKFVTTVVPVFLFLRYICLISF